MAASAIFGLETELAIPNPDFRCRDLRQALPAFHSRHASYLNISNIMDLQFQFVDNGAISASARRLIRSHVMKKKNLGRKITRGAKTREPAALSEAATADLQTGVPAIVTKYRTETFEEHRWTPSLRSSRGSLPDLGFSAEFPIALDAASEALLKRCMQPS